MSKKELLKGLGLSRAILSPDGQKVKELLMRAEEFVSRHPDNEYIKTKYGLAIKLYQD